TSAFCCAVPPVVLPTEVVPLELSSDLLVSPYAAARSSNTLIVSSTVLITFPPLLSDEDVEPVTAVPLYFCKYSLAAVSLRSIWLTDELYDGLSKQHINALVAVSILVPLAQSSLVREPNPYLLLALVHTPELACNSIRKYSI